VPLRDASYDRHIGIGGDDTGLLREAVKGVTGLRLDAYAAVQTGDAKLATRAWSKFYHSDGYTESSPWKTEKLSGPVTLVPGSEANWVYTNDTALYGLAAIENLALLGDGMP